MSIINKAVLLCLALLISALVAVFIFKVSTNSIVILGLALACPLTHILMMGKGHKH